MRTLSHLPPPRASASLRIPHFARPLRVVSGGQTGADRAALLWALARGIPVSGWAPKNQWAEDGRVPRHFGLRETPSASPARRTLWNVRDSDATILFTPRLQTTGGCRLTARCAARIGRPLLHLHAQESPLAAARLARFLLLRRPRILNVAGSRASQAPAISAWVRAVLDRALLKAPARWTRRPAAPVHPSPGGH